MTDPVFVIAASSLVGLAVVAFALLRAWHEWLDYKRQELDRARSLACRAIDTPEHGHGVQQRSPAGSARIELADLRERIRKLEAIASGVEL